MGVRSIFTAKQTEVWHQVIDNDKWTLMINSGAVRAGKTYVDNFIFLHELRRASALAKSKGEVGQFILAGADSGSIQSNILFELANLGVDFRFDKNNFIHFNDNIFRNIIVKQAYTGTIAGLQHIRGMTAYGAYVNEATMANKAVFDEIRNRCSIKGSRVVCDTNPDVPTHYIKELIDKAKTSEFVIANNFTIDDNAENLDANYIQSLKETTPSGMFYDRKILGKWVSSEGIVYSDFDIKRDVITNEQFKEIRKHHQFKYYCGVDWGFGAGHKGSIVLLADDEDNNTYAVEIAAKEHKGIDYWIQKAREVTNQYGNNIPFYCDSARPDYVSQFHEEGFNAMNGYKSRIAGVEMVSTKMKSNKFRFIVDDQKQSEFLKEIYEYVWDEKTGLPVKKNDDVMDSLRYGIATKLWLEEQQSKRKSNVKQAKILQNMGLT